MDNTIAPERQDDSDAELARRCLAGHPDAFRAVMRRHNRRLVRLAYSILRDRDEADDAVQDAYVRAFQSLTQLEDPARFPTWLATIVVNEARGRLRRSRRTGPLDDEVTQTEIVPMFTQPTASPERLALAGELRRVLERAIDDLPGPFRTVFMLRGVEGLNVAETAACLGIPAATVKTRFHRARALLRQSLQAEAESLLPDLYAFDGARCERIVAAVMKQLSLG
ncbi:MAG TPA: RNA polymerase sigma factor [Alphaproteobacteria bacterium]|nr:RNA polymerase sigma factor [Alphaproteobacteria bacterium]